MGSLEEIQHQGLKFTMDDLARRLGVSKKTLYKYYSSKAELLDEIIDFTLENMEEKANAIIHDEQLSLIEKLKGVITVTPDHYQLTDLRILNQMKRYYPEQWSKMDSFLKSDWEIIQDLVKQGIEEGIIKDINVSLIMRVIIESINTSLDQTFYLENQLTPTEALNDIADILLNGLIPENKR